MKKKKLSRLLLSRETIHVLTSSDLAGVHGGATTYPTESCACDGVPITPRASAVCTTKKL